MLRSTRFASGIVAPLFAAAFVLAGCSSDSGTAADDTGAEGDADAAEADAADVAADVADADAASEADAEAAAPCSQASDCPLPDGECVTRACKDSRCAVDFTAKDTAVASQTAGDCQKKVCDGNGAIVSVNDDADLPDDGKQCTQNVCTAGVPSNPPVGGGIACNEGGGSVCDGAGTCAGCVTASECPGADDECKRRTCKASACGFDYTANGTAVAAQTPADCKKNVCNGSGSIVGVADDVDAPVDGKQCTQDVCAGGVASNPPVSAGGACTEGGGKYCNGGGACVGCTSPTQCPGTDGECQSRTCNAGVCGMSFVGNGTAIATQTSGDCKKRVCNGSGAIVPAADDADLPVDGKECTQDVCTSGTPSNPAVASGAACSESGGSKCNGAGACVQCLAPSECPGSDGPCQTRTCTAGVCGVVTKAAGAAAAIQTPGDCHVDLCTAAGGVVTNVDDSDVPVDGKACTQDVCAAGVPSNPPSLAGAGCSEAGGKVCNGGGACVQCVVATDCGTSSFCRTRTCNAGVCGATNTTIGAALPAADQATGDCHQLQCDGAGGTISAVDDADLPNDGKQCTSDVCTMGSPTNPNLAAGSACSQSGVACDGLGACVAAPTVLSTSPADGTSALASGAIAITFSTAMDPSTLTGQTVAGSCTGTIQISLDNFSTCVALAGAAPSMSVGNTVATVVAAPGLLVNRVYRIRVGAAAKNMATIPMGAQYTQPTGFTTGSPPTTALSGVVISQVYGGGGNSGAPYTNDFVELHNRGAGSVSVAGWSVQYGSATGTSLWSTVALTGSIPAGGYYLVQMGGGASGVALPLADAATGAFNMSATAGKAALVNSTTALSGACPSSATIVDLVGWGGANCSEGTAAAGAPSGNNTTAIRRAGSGCTDTANNVSDFSTAAPAPRNTASAPVGCGGTVFVLNESNTTTEANWCAVQAPLSLNVAAGSTVTVYGQLFETGVTPPAGAPANVLAQLGYGPAIANPQYEAGWTWLNATYNTTCTTCGTNNDEYYVAFSAPGAGSYRYVYRFSLDNGASWTLCDNTGAGTDPNMTFDFGDEAVMTTF